MILKGSQRGGARALAAHLLNDRDNDFIEVAAINGFMSDTVDGAFQEIQAAGRATSCKQFMFSLSLSPPEDSTVSEQDFQIAIEAAMVRLGLSGQPHVVIYHEKNGRRHCHLVVSRIKSESMKAVNLSFFKEKLCRLSRELFLTHGWKLPDGHVDRALSDPLNYSLEEHQVAKRAGRDPKIIKEKMKECWVHSDDAASFISALEEAGFKLCQGDRRAFVVLDVDGNVYSLSRWMGIRTKNIIGRLGEPGSYPSIAEVNSQISAEPEAGTDNPGDRISADDPHVISLRLRIETLQSQKAELLSAQREERDVLKQKHNRETIDQINAFQAAQTRLKDLWNLITGKRQAVIAQRQAVLAELRRKQELEFLETADRQRKELRFLRAKITVLSIQLEALCPQGVVQPQTPVFEKPADPDFLFHQRLIQKSPDHVLNVVNDKKAVFTRNDVVRTLSDYVSDPASLRLAIDQVMAAPELVRLGEGDDPKYDRFTTRNFQTLEAKLFATASQLAETKAYGVQKRHMKAAIRRQNAALQKQIGASLSEEQCKAIEHVLNRRQLSCVVGLAGAGKSTMLSAAKEAWTRQGYRVVGGALSGKAADGLESASQIPSRTLASWVHGWKHNRNFLQAGDVFVIDEAGMVGSRQLSAMIDHVKEQGAKLVLVGDPDQLQPINAGTPFRRILDGVCFTKLTEVRRQKLDWQKAASLDLSRGDTCKAIKAYEDHGCLEIAENHKKAIAALVEDYMVDLELHGDRKSRLALAYSRSDAFEINRAIQKAKRSSGELFDERTFNTAHGPRTFAVGDRIMFTRNDSTSGVRNGDFGTIESIAGSNICALMDAKGCSVEGQKTLLDIRRYNAIEYGYATTIHKSQGTTVSNTFTLLNRHMDDHLKYVAMTRHSESLKSYGIKKYRSPNFFSTDDRPREMEFDL